MFFFRDVKCVKRIYGYLCLIWFGGVWNGSVKREKKFIGGEGFEVFFYIEFLVKGWKILSGGLEIFSVGEVVREVFRFFIFCIFGL